MCVFTVTVVAMTMLVVMLMILTVAVLLVLQGQCSGLVAGSHVESVFLLQPPTGLVPLRLHLGQSPEDELHLRGGRGADKGDDEERDKGTEGRMDGGESQE